MRYLALALGIGSAFAQTPSAAITSPGSGTPTLTADAGQVNYRLTSTCSSCGNIGAALYYLDGTASIPGSGELLGISRLPPYSFIWNPYYASNGAHTVQVNYLDVMNNVLATSPAVSFMVLNNLPQESSPTSYLSMTAGLVAQMGVAGFGNVTNAISFYSTSGTPEVVGNAPCGSVGETTSVTNCGTTTAENTLAVYTRWQSSSSTLTCSGSGGAAGTVAYGAVTEGSSYSGQWAYIYNIAGGASSVITCTNSSSAEFIGTIAFQISGIPTTNPADVNVASMVSLAPAQTGVITFSHPVANEVLLVGATWTGDTTATAGAGWTNIFTESSGVAVEWINPPSALFGVESVTLTENGGNSASSKTLSLFAGGVLIGTNGSGSTAASYKFVVNTTQFLNGNYQLVARADIGNCAGCTDGVWSDAGGTEVTQTFLNNVVPSQLLMSAREVQMLVNGSAQTITGTDLNTDGSTAAATITGCVPNSTTYFTVALSGGACIVTPGSVAGNDFITATDSNGLTRVFWPFVWNPGEATIPNWNSSGQYQQGYTSSSVWRASLFNYSCDPFSATVGAGSSVNYPGIWGAAMVAAGYNTIECGITVPGVNQSSFESAVMSQISSIGGNLGTYGLGFLKYVHLIGTSWFENTPVMYNTIFGAGSPVSPSNPSGGSAAWTITPLTYTVQQWVAIAGQPGTALGLEWCDECPWGGNPLEGTNTGGIVIGTNSFSSLAATSGTLTITWPQPQNDRFTGSGRFIITGSGTALDYNPSTNAPIFVVSCAATQCTAPNTSTYTGTITSGTLQLQTYVNNAFTSTGIPCSSTSGTIPPDPCPTYLPYNIFSTIWSWLTSVTNYIPMDVTFQGGGTAARIQGWSNAVAGVGPASQTYVQYTGNSGAYYLPSHQPLFELISQYGDQTRSITLNGINRKAPYIGESETGMTQYFIGPYPAGYQITVVSCSGNTITTSTNHLIRNVIPDFTKVTVHGSGSAACDGNYYIIAAPTSTTLLVVQAKPSFTLASTTIGGTVNFSNTIGGSTVNSYTLSTMSATATSTIPGQFEITSACPNTFKNNRDLYFTVSGSSNANVNAMTGWFDTGYTTNACYPDSGGKGPSYWRQVPNLSSTGGTAYIMPSGWYQRGINWPTNSDYGQRLNFAIINELGIEGFSGHRAYAMHFDPQSSDLTGIGLSAALTCQVCTGAGSQGVSEGFNGTDYNSPTTSASSGVDFVTDYGKSLLPTQAHTVANLIWERIISYAFGTRLSSPDYGLYFEAAARTSAKGNILMWQSFLDDPVTCTANLAPYLVAGQPIIRFSMTWDSIQAVDIITAGTTSDTTTCAPGEFRAYLFPKNTAAERNQPAISAKLSDVTNAASILVRYSYSALSFRTPSVAAQTLYQVYNCGTGSCRLPVDKTIGTLYYELIYLNSIGTVLATSDVQTL